MCINRSRFFHEYLLMSLTLTCYLPDHSSPFPLLMYKLHSNSEMAGSQHPPPGCSLVQLVRVYSGFRIVHECPVETSAAHYRTGLCLWSHGPHSRAERRRSASIPTPGGAGRTHRKCGSVLLSYHPRIPAPRAFPYACIFQMYFFLICIVNYLMAHSFCCAIYGF